MPSNQQAQLLHFLLHLSISLVALHVPTCDFGPSFLAFVPVMLPRTGAPGTPTASIFSAFVPPAIPLSFSRGRLSSRPPAVRTWAPSVTSSFVWAGRSSPWAASMPRPTATSASTKIETQKLAELHTGFVQVHKIAESASFASSFFVLAASGFSKVRDWRELWHEQPSFVGLGLHGFERFCSIFFVAKLHVHVTIHVFCFVGAHVHAFYLTMLGHFTIDVFVEVVEVVLSFHWIHVVSPSERIDVHVGNQQGRTNGRSIVLPRAPLSMPVAPPRQLDPVGVSQHRSHLHVHTHLHRPILK